MKINVDRYCIALQIIKRLLFIKRNRTRSRQHHDISELNVNCVRIHWLASAAYCCNNAAPVGIGTKHR
ncbi:hypothetical protein D3C80_2076370 [compost metagenome]